MCERCLQEADVKSTNLSENEIKARYEVLFSALELDKPSNVMRDELKSI